jgi:hypothetical protein
MPSNPRIRREARRLLRLCTTDALVDEERAALIARHLAKDSRPYRLTLLKCFSRFVRLHQARRQVCVQSAVTVPPQMKLNLESALTKAYGPGLHITFSTDPDLIGGLRISVAGDVYDGSVRSALQTLAASFESNAPPSLAFANFP